MSSGTEGPGWWQASDGRWYPPHLHPDPARAAHNVAAPEMEGSPRVDSAPGDAADEPTPLTDSVVVDPTIEAPAVSSPRWSASFDKDDEPPSTEVLPQVAPELAETQAHPVVPPPATGYAYPPPAGPPPSASPWGAGVAAEFPLPPEPGTYPAPPAAAPYPAQPQQYPPQQYPPQSYAPAPYGPPPAGPAPYSPGTPQGVAQGPPTYVPGPPQPGAQVPGGYLPPIGAPQPPVSTPPGDRGRNWVLAVLAIIVGVALLGWVVQDLSSGGEGTAVVSNPSGSTFGGESGGTSSSGNAELDEVIDASLASIEAYWEEEYPEVFGTALPPLNGGYASYTQGGPLPPCVEESIEILNNAFYCFEADVVAWDSGFFEDLAETFGDWSVAIVLAHEWGHVVQLRAEMQGQTVTFEHQADCYAGAWVGSAEGLDVLPEFTGVVRDQAAAGFLVLGDAPGTPVADEMAHGSAFDRLKAFQDGITNGASSCATYTDSTIDLIDLPFLSMEDFNRGGDLPFNEVFPIASEDLNDFWATVAEDRFNDDWLPLEVTVGSGSLPDDCATDEDASIGWCGDAAVAVRTSEAMDNLYSELGDFAPVTILSRVFADAARSAYEFPESSLSEDEPFNDCLSGAWTRSVYEQDRATEDGAFALSPGDLDEAVGALLLWPILEGGSSSSTGFDSVAAFSAGLSGGVAAC